jgi:peptidoglycan/LPS O-acetylase OafA/YrhL
MGLVRLFLALVVAFGHGQLVFFAPLGITISDRKNALYAVLFFYVISGYLITFTLSRNYAATAHGIGQFYVNRFIRIFSLFWPVFAFVFWYNGQARTDFLNASLIDQWTSLFLFGVDWRFSFGKPGGYYEGATLELLLQSWSLGAELTFYALVPLFMRRWKLTAALLVASLCLRVFFAVLKWEPILWSYTFFPATVAFFLLGHFTMKAGERWTALKSPRLGISLVALSLVDMALMPSVAFDDLRFWIAMLLFIAGLPVRAQRA